MLLLGGFEDDADAKILPAAGIPIISRPCVATVCLDTQSISAKRLIEDGFKVAGTYQGDDGKIALLIRGFTPPPKKSKKKHKK